jgi:hypothetical protein
MRFWGSSSLEMSCTLETGGVVEHEERMGMAERKAMAADRTMGVKMLISCCCRGG